MSAVGDETIHEVDFCSLVASTATALFTARPDAFPFVEARVEGFGALRKRHDLRFFDANGKLAICGEVKLPGMRDGQSPYDTDLVWDACRKADDAGVQYFFTWNVNTFVLWDRSQWDKPFLERRVREWRLGLQLYNPRDVARASTREHIQTKFLPDLLRDIADIYTGRRRDWGMPPDEVFLRSLESRLDWPVRLTHDYMAQQAGSDRAFSQRLEQWMTAQEWNFVRGDPDQWSSALDTAARSLAYVWTNRLIFYKALRSRFPELPRLELPPQVDNPLRIQSYLRDLFAKAVQRSGDYETLLMPADRDWASGLVFEADGAIVAWRAFLRGIESIDFREVRSDIVGRIFQKLISPEERHKYGQHFTGDDVVDVINAFCVRRAEDTVLDPACGSGSFLVRAYYRKKAFSPGRTHGDLISELFGCDISPYPAHLATLNLAAREINDEANYPRVLRRDFFHVGDDGEFGALPDPLTHEKARVLLPKLDAIVGNPPYVRQEKVAKGDKNHMATLVSRAWNGMKLTGRADLHCYFWPAATRFLKPDGMFGFLTSSSWLDVEYGFALQAWALSHFQIIAIMESAAEPWFPDARVKTCVTILHRCDDPAARAANLVRFVRFNKPLSQIIGERTDNDKGEAQRLHAVEHLRKKIASTSDDMEDDDLRIIVRKQEDLWREGVRAGAVLTASPAVAQVDQAEAEAADEPSTLLGDGEYRAGKWGRYLRAPDIYFRVMRQHAPRFVCLGELVEIRRGITSGCDSFFMPSDVTTRELERCVSELEFKGRTGVARRDVQSGKLKIIEDGAGLLHPIEAEYLAPEVHSLMKVDRPVVRAADLDRVVLLVSDKLSALRGTWVHRYLKYGETAEFESRKSAAGPIPQRPTCAGRDPWYDLTGLVKPGFAFWPKAQQYRHIIPANPTGLICNCNLYDVAPRSLSEIEQQILIGVLNSTLVGLFKTFYGRFAGTEGNLKTEVVDVNLLEVPDPRKVGKRLAARIIKAVEHMCRRDIGHLVEEQLMNCHSPERAQRIAQLPIVLSNELQQEDRHELDDAVLELIGITDPGERKQLLEELYRETALHFRSIRVVEIQKMEQRSTGGAKRFTPLELAADAWDAVELDDLIPLAEWIQKTGAGTRQLTIPDDRPAEVADSMFDAKGTVNFGKGQQQHIQCDHEAQAELVAHLCNEGASGTMMLPAQPAKCLKLLAASEKRLSVARAHFAEVAAKRAGSQELAQQVANILMRWFAVGRNAGDRFAE